MTLARETERSGKSFNDGQWHHAALTVDEKQGFVLYINGRRELRGKTGRMGVWHLWHVPTNRMGLRTGSGDRVNTAAIDELYVYERVLPAEEIKTLCK